MGWGVLRDLWRRSSVELRAFVAFALFLGLVLGNWEQAVNIAVVFGAIVVISQVLRRRALRANRAARAAGRGEWAGWISYDSAWWLWVETDGARAADIPEEGLPARITTDDHGLVAEVRGRFNRLRFHPVAVRIPWSEVAGARERPVGYVRPGGTVSGARLTAVTLDLVGAAAGGWRELYVWSDAEIAASAEIVFRAELEEYRRESAADAREEFPDRAPGTAPLEFWTTAPDGLAAYVDRAKLGRPDPSLDPEFAR